MFYNILVLWLLTELLTSPLLPIHLFQIVMYIVVLMTGVPVGLLVVKDLIIWPMTGTLGLAEVVAIEVFKTPFYRVDCLGRA
jgi:hypothetical protein